MAVRTTVDIPEDLHSVLKDRALRTGSSIRALVVDALEESYRPKKKGRLITGPFLKLKGKPGPLMALDRNPHELILP